MDTFIDALLFLSAGFLAGYLVRLWQDEREWNEEDD